MSISLNSPPDAITGQTQQFAIGFGQGVALNSSGGAPTLSLSDGATASFDANASSPSSGNLVFDYTVGASDYSIELSTTALNLNGATLTDTNGVAIDVSGAAELDLGLHVNAAVVDAVTASRGSATVAAPTLEALATNETAGEALTLELHTNKAVIVDTTSSSPTLSLDDGATATYDADASDPSKGTLIFDYRVAAGDRSPNLEMVAVNLNGATINDANRNPADLSNALLSQTGLAIGEPVCFAEGTTIRTDRGDVVVERLSVGDRVATVYQVRQGRSAGSATAFRALARPGEDAKRVVDMDGCVLFEKAGNATSPRPEVDRGELRHLLHASLPEGTVRWNRQVASVMTNGGQHTITFTDGTTVAADLIIGADGAWSKVRLLLSDIKPAYTGTCFIEDALLDGAARNQASVDAIGTGTLMAVAPGRGIMVHRYRDGTARGYAALNKPEEWIRSIDFGDMRAGLVRLAEQFKGFAPHLTTFITDSDTVPVLRPIYALPVSYRWHRTPGFTLLGDAAHLMSPFAGEGANLALYDAAELAKALVMHPQDIEAALAAYEAGLFPCGGEVAEASAENLARFFGEAAPGSVVELFWGIS